MFRPGYSSDATLWTSLLVISARPTRILYIRPTERPKLFRTVEFSPGARVREVKLPSTLGWTSSLSATEGLLRYTFSSIQNSPSSLDGNKVLVFNADLACSSVASVSALPSHGR